VFYRPIDEFSAEFVSDPHASRHARPPEEKMMVNSGGNSRVRNTLDAAAERSVIMQSRG